MVEPLCSLNKQCKNTLQSEHIWLIFMKYLQQLCMSLKIYHIF
jgi:hypothetical protein